MYKTIVKISIIFIVIIGIIIYHLYNKNNNFTNKQQIQENYITDYDDIKDLLPNILPTNFEINFNWASKNNQYGKICITPVKNQGTCGCCWACVVTTLLESAYYRGTISYNNKPPIVFSTQQIIDCLSVKPNTISKPSSGCDGGWPIKSINAYLGLKGKNMCTEDQYPLTANKQIGSEENAFLKWILKTFGSRTVYSYPGCQQDSSSHCKDNPIWFPSVEVITFTPENLSESLLKKAIYWLGPIYLSCQIPFQFIIKGILFKNYVYSGKLDKGGDHAMVLTGWGTTSKGKEYWIVQNSWGEWWGNDGFVWITRDIDYIKKYVDEMAAVKIQRNCVDISPNGSSENSVICIEIINAYQKLYPKINNKTNPKNITFIEFKITVYISVNDEIDSIIINIPNFNEKRLANLNGLIDTENNIIESKDSQILVINDENNYYYNKYGIVEEPKSYNWSKRWFVIRKKTAWYSQNFSSEWTIIVKIKDKSGLEVNVSSVYINWGDDPVSVSYSV